MEVSVFFALLYIPWLQGVLSADIKNNLKYFEVIHAKSFGHNIVKRGIHPSDHPFNKIREVNFKVRNKRIFLSRSYFVHCADHLIQQRILKIQVIIHLTKLEM